MSEVRVTFLGTGDPFGTGGRFQSCILLEGAGRRVLLDCGATTMTALSRAGIDPGSIDAVLLSHWHGDHAGGLPFLVLESLLGVRDGARHPPRTRPLVIAGPAGTDQRVRQALEVFNYGAAFPAAREAGLVEFIELRAGRTTTAGPLSVAAFAAAHTPEALMMRVACDGRVVGYSGDTAWTETLVDVAAGADLFICIAYAFERPQQTVLTYREVMERREQLRCKRLILTHIGGEMQSRLAEVVEEVAEDGVVIDL